MNLNLRNTSMNMIDTVIVLLRDEGRLSALSYSTSISRSWSLVKDVKIL